MVESIRGQDTTSIAYTVLGKKNVRAETVIRNREIRVNCTLEKFMRCVPAREDVEDTHPFRFLKKFEDNSFLLVFREGGRWGGIFSWGIHPQYIHGWGEGQRLLSRNLTRGGSGNEHIDTTRRRAIGRWLGSGYIGGTGTSATNGIQRFGDYSRGLGKGARMVYSRKGYL